nr:DUF1643 domain-containing protein [uncultured Dongia sp.]
MTDMLTQRHATFSDDGDLRWTLTRSFLLAANGGKGLMWIGGNPAKAGADSDDMTSMRWDHFTKAWGYSRYLGMNPIPKISSTPDDARAWLMGGGIEVDAAIEHNLSLIEALAPDYDMHVVCWGNIVQNDWLLDRVIKAINRPLFCLGTNSDGSPRHPMARGRHRVPDDQQPVLWRDAA